MSAIEREIDVAARFSENDLAPAGESEESYLDYLKSLQYRLIQNDGHWAGWQMDVLTDEFDWSTGWFSPAFDNRVSGVGVPGLSVELLGPLTKASFDPLPTGTLVEINARIAYKGTVSVAGPIRIQQFPTPEPSTLLCLLLPTPFMRRR